MKKFFYLVPLAVATANLMSCTSDIAEQVNGIEENQKLSFAPYVNMPTRALEKSVFVANDAFLLNACLTEGVGLNDNFTSNFMSNTVVTKQSDGIWTYADAKFWPDNVDDRISFVVNYPEGLLPEITDGAVSWHFNVDGDPLMQSDFMWSSITDAHRNDRNGSYQNGLVENPSTSPLTNVPLLFKHALSRISFRATATNNYQGATVKITGITLSGLKGSGTYTLNKQLGQGTWTLDEVESVNYVALENGSQTVSSQGYAPCGQSLLLIPQTLDENATVTITYEVAYSSPSKTVSESKTFALAANGLKNNNTWEENKTYTYSFGVALDMITFEATVAAWGSNVSGITLN